MTAKTALDRLYMLQEQTEQELASVRLAHARSRDYVSNGAFGELQQYILGRLTGINAGIALLSQVKDAKEK